MRSEPLLLALAACTYLPPPDVKLDVPTGGTFVVGDALHLTFSEAIDKNTLSISVYPDDRDVEGNLPAATAPLLADCNPFASPCGTTTLEVDQDLLGATIRFDRNDLGKPDVPLLLEVGPALADKAHEQARTIPAWFSFQYKPLVGMNTGPVTFANGDYLIVAEITDPIPATLILVTAILVKPDGRFALDGAKGKAIMGAPTNTHDPTQIDIDTSSNGFVAFTQGFLFQTDTDRFVQTEPIDLRLSISGISLELAGLEIDGKVVTNPATSTDQIDGTLSYQELILNPDAPSPYHYPAGGTDFAADRIPDGEVPAGSPDICTDPCGAITTQCVPPDGWPDAEICTP
jgi:hypothetical protein